MLAFAAFSVILVVAVFLAQIDTQMKLKNIRYQQTTTHAERVANKLSNSIAPYQLALQAYSKHPDVRAAIQSGNTRDMNQAVQQFKPTFDGVLELRLFKGTKTALNESLTPPISYACLDLFNSARSNLTSPLEIHAADTPQQHLGLVQTVTDNKGHVLGSLQLVLDASLLELVELLAQLFACCAVKAFILHEKLM